MSQFEERDQKIVELYYRVGHTPPSVSEMSTQFGITRNAVTGILFRHRQKVGMKPQVPQRRKRTPPPAPRTTTPAAEATGLPTGNVVPRKAKSKAEPHKRRSHAAERRAVALLGLPLLPPTEDEIFMSYANQIILSSKSMETTRWFYEETVAATARTGPQ